MAFEDWMDAPARTPGDWVPYRWSDGFADLLGPIFMLDLAGPDLEVLRLGLRVRQKHCNRMSICHGGALATIADNALGLNANFASGTDAPTPTISMAMDFLKPAPLGSWVETRVRVVHLTRNMIFVEGRLVIAGEPIMRCNAVFKRQKSANDALDKL